MENHILLVIFVVLSTLCEVGGQDEEKQPCTAAICRPPECYCSTTRIPEDFDANKVPQMIIFSFSGPIRVEEGEYIRDLFNKKRRNPNGSPIRATLFVSDDKGKTDYCTVNHLWAQGHEVASFSVTRQEPAYDWVTANQKFWEQEIELQKQYIVDNTSIPASDIVGMRSPHLKTGDNTQYKFATAFNYTYDSSIVLPAKYNEATQPKLWPYTMDTKGDFDCAEPPCPSASFPGFWQIPFQPLTDAYGKPCRRFDRCVNSPIDAEEEVNNKHFVC